MILSTLEIKGNIPFQTYLLSDTKVKKIIKEFDFYSVVFYREEYASEFVVQLRYPKGNLYWYLDFEKTINKHLCVEPEYELDWKDLLSNLKHQIRKEFNELSSQLKRITARDVVIKTVKYQLRDYQAFDLLQFLIKFKELGNKGLILSDPRTGKSRVALAACGELLVGGDVALIICPKSAQIGWSSEIIKLNEINEMFITNIISRISDLKKLELNTDLVNVRIISYDMFKKLTVPQIRQLTSNSKHVIFVGDEIHRLRNFKTDQSKAIFSFKDFCVKDKVSLGIIGLTGTISVKDSTDVFGTLSLINDSKIQFRPYYESFNCFKEYFYYCEDTSFGKVAKALRREHELNYIIQTCSVQTKQKDLELFKGYSKSYVKIELDMDKQQEEIYESVYENMEYDEDIDCQNKLVQLVRLQQICIDPSVLVASYGTLSPKLRWVIGFAKKNSFKFIVACKKAQVLKHLMKVLDTYCINYASLLGSYNFNDRKDQLLKFETEKDCKIMVLQFDTGKESLTLPMAYATIFLDRDFAQGFNEQAEARMTPIDGSSCTKYVIDLVMKGTKEEEIYNTLVIKKKSIDAMNLVFKPRKGE